MEKFFIFTVIGLGIAAGFGFYVYEKLKRPRWVVQQSVDDSDEIAAANTELQLLIQDFKDKAFRYYIQSWGNRKQISVTVERVLREQYEFVLSPPLLMLSERMSCSKKLVRKVALAYLEKKGVKVDDWTYEGAVLEEYLRKEAEIAAEAVVSAAIADDLKD